MARTTTQTQQPQPEPQAAPPQPMSVAVLKVLKTTYAAYVAAGGAPIYGPTPPAIPPTVTPP